MAAPNQYLRRRSSLPFFTAESTPGNFVYPATTDALPTVNPLDMGQNMNYSDITEVGTRLLTTRSVLNYAERSENSVEMISKVKESPTSGQSPSEYLPAENFLLDKLFGAVTVKTGVSAINGTEHVEYTFEYEGSTFQIAQITDTYLMKVAQGTMVTGGSLEISREGVMTWNLNTRSSQIRYGGTSEVSASTEDGVSSTLTNITVSNAGDVMFVGMKFNILSGQTGTYGQTMYSELEVAGITGDVVTFETDPALFGTSIALGDFIVPHLPDGATISYAPIPQGTASIYLAPVNSVIGTGVGELFNDANKFLATSFSLNVEKNLADPGLNELNGLYYPAPTYVAQEYNIDGSMEMVVRPNETFRFNQALNTPEQSLGVKIEGPSGRLIYIAIPSARISFEGTEVDGAEGATMNWMLTQGTSADDAAAFKLIYA